MGFPRHSAGTIFDISVRSPRLFVPGCFPPWLDLCVLNGPTAGVTSVSKLVVWWLREQQQQQQRGEGPLRLFRLSMTFTSWKVAALLYIKLSILPSQHGGAELLIWLPAPYHSSPLLNDARGFREILIGVDRCITAKSSLRSQWIIFFFFFAEGNRNNQRDGRTAYRIEAKNDTRTDFFVLFFFFFLKRLDFCVWDGVTS
jgi:hypothetical protein